MSQFFEISMLSMTIDYYLYNILIIPVLFIVNTFAAKHLKKPIPQCQACFKDS